MWAFFGDTVYMLLDLYMEDANLYKYIITTLI